MFQYADFMEFFVTIKIIIKEVEIIGTLRDPWVSKGALGISSFTLGENENILKKEGCQG